MYYTASGIVTLFRWSSGAQDERGQDPQLSICSAYVERGSFFLMYRMCSRNLNLSFDWSARHKLCGTSCT